MVLGDKTHAENLAKRARPVETEPATPRLTPGRLQGGPKIRRSGPSNPGNPTTRRDNTTRRKLDNHGRSSSDTVIRGNSRCASTQSARFENTRAEDEQSVQATRPCFGPARGRGKCIVSRQDCTALPRLSLLAKGMGSTPLAFPSSPKCRETIPDVLSFPEKSGQHFPARIHFACDWGSAPGRFFRLPKPLGSAPGRFSGFF